MTVRALGISVHTGWGACVVVTGSLAKPVIVANERVQILGDDERFCFHMAADMKRPEAEGCLYRDVFSAASGIPVTIVPPATLDDALVGKLAPPPWGKDQRLAALAAWSVIGGARSVRRAGRV